MRKITVIHNAINRTISIPSFSGLSVGEAIYLRDMVDYAIKELEKQDLTSRVMSPKAKTGYMKRLIV